MSKDKLSFLTLPKNVSKESNRIFIEEIEECKPCTGNLLFIDCSSLEEVTDDFYRLLIEISKNNPEKNIRFLINKNLDNIPDSIIPQCISGNEFCSEFNDLINKIEYKDEFHPTENDVLQANANFNDKINNICCTEKTKYVIKTIFYEYINNIKIHSNMNKDKKITIKIAFNLNEIEIVITDHGKPFNICEKPDGPYISPMYDIERYSFGIQLIKTLSDNIEYETNPDKNITTIMCKRYKT